MGAPIKVGDVIAGKYQIERVLGAGGMGVVMAARHLKLGERVAIKFLQREVLMDPIRVERFLREGRACARIRGEHIARVYDIGTLENDAPYIVMEYLRGSDLSALVKQRGPLPVNTATEYGLQVCEALAEAHSVGIVHRDLKPANLFVTERSDGSPMIKVIDFGIAKVIEGADGSVDATKTGEEIRGSPLYMSPEQMRRPRQLDVRSDIWSFGVTLYNLLTGSYPFFSMSVLELCGMIFQEAPAPLREKRADVPPELETVILRCLEKDANKRYQDVGELAAALAEFAPPEARPSAERAARILRFKRAPDSARQPHLTNPDLLNGENTPALSPSAILEGAARASLPGAMDFGAPASELAWVDASGAPSTIPSPSPLDYMSDCTPDRTSQSTPAPSPRDHAPRAPRAPQPSSPLLDQTSQSPSVPPPAHRLSQPSQPPVSTTLSRISQLPPVSGTIGRASQSPVSTTLQRITPQPQPQPQLGTSPLATSQLINVVTSPTGSIWTSTEPSQAEPSEVKKPKATAKWAVAGMVALAAGGAALALLRPQAAVPDSAVSAAPPAGESPAAPAVTAPEPATAAPAPAPLAPPSVASAEASAEAVAAAASADSKPSASSAQKSAPAKKTATSAPRPSSTGKTQPKPAGGLFKTRK
jgi:serine/threonine protein kinase